MDVPSKQAPGGEEKVDVPSKLGFNSYSDFIYDLNYISRMKQEIGRHSEVGIG